MKFVTAVSDIKTNFVVRLTMSKILNDGITCSKFIFNLEKLLFTLLTPNNIIIFTKIMIRVLFINCQIFFILNRIEVMIIFSSFTVTY